MASVNLLIVSLGGGGAERVVAELYSSYLQYFATPISSN